MVCFSHFSQFIETMESPIGGATRKRGASPEPTVKYIQYNAANVALCDITIDDGHFVCRFQILSFMDLLLQKKEALTWLL